MPLLSQLFKGDPALEDAANRDAAHIVRGARGPHVEKIQQALNILDDAELQVDGIYGSATANAVLQYKRNRNIVNRSYQDTADDIVGRMTMAKLDEEMLAHENLPEGKIELIPISPQASYEKAYPRLQVAPAKSKMLVAFKINNVLPTDVVSIDIGQTAEIEVKNGKGYELEISLENALNPRAKIVDPDSKELVRSIEITKNSMIVKVRGLTWGTETLTAFKPHLLGGSDFEKLVIEVKDNRPNVYHPTVEHHHEPVDEPGEWNEVCKEAAKDPNLIFTLKRLADISASPDTVATTARLSLQGPLGGEPSATAHFDYYLSGRGGVVNEDARLKRWVEGSSHTRGVIAKRIRDKRQPGQTTVEFNFEYNATMYDDEDIKDSFGTIDTLDVYADFNKGTIELWFEDTYEWHPTYSQYTKPFKCPNTNATGAVQRDTIFLHAAMVQMKKRGAKDFKMRGNATFPMKIFQGL